jgi:hypothetical protein
MTSKTRWPKRWTASAARTGPRCVRVRDQKRRNAALVQLVDELQCPDLQLPAVACVLGPGSDGPHHRSQANARRQVAESKYALGTRRLD